MGIGPIPDSVLTCLNNHKDLRPVHVMVDSSGRS